MHSWSTVVRAALPPTLWAYRPRKRFEELPEDVELIGAVPDRPGDHQADFRVHLDAAGLYRLVGGWPEVAHYLAALVEGVVRVLELDAECAAHAQALLDHGLTAESAWKHLSGQLLGIEVPSRSPPEVHQSAGEPSPANP